MKKLDISKKFLIKEYTKREKSIFKIARELVCGYTCIRYILIKYNIPIRTISEATKGTKNWKYNPKKHKKHYCINCGKELSDYRHKRCGSCANKKSMRFRIEAMLKGMNKKPNKPEKLLNKLLQKILPNEYKYTGNSEIFFGSFNPDFVNCNRQKKIIELYGDYWHNLPKEKKLHKRRIKTYKKYGYKILIVWEYELKDLEMLIAKIMQFE